MKKLNTFLSPLVVAAFLAMSFGFVPTPIEAATANITQLDFTAATTPLDVNEVGEFTVQTQNSTGTEEQLDTSGTKLVLTTNSATGEFSSNGTSDWIPGSIELTMNNGWANRTFYYRDSAAGNPVLTVTAKDGAGPHAWTQDTQSVVIEATTTTPILNPENFNTHSGSDYKGMNVGFNIENFGTVTSVKVSLYKGDELLVTNTHNQNLLNTINGTPGAFQRHSTPFIMTPGTYVETHWNLGTFNWTADDKPTKAVIEVTDGSGTKTVTNENLDEPNGWTFEALLPPTPPTQETVVITGNTSSAENDPGWFFNRDQTTVTPFEFTEAEASIGDGSIYVLPIGTTTASDKFIAEHFEQIPVENLNSISYDFMIGQGGEVADADHFYLNVYANIDNSNNFYDCRYDYVPSTGTVGAWTTASFSSTDTPVNVRKRGDRIGTCPATLAQMPAGSHVRMFSVSVGDTSLSDAGLDGYLDKVVLNTDSEITTYDFELDQPSNGGGSTSGGGGGTLSPRNNNDDDGEVRGASSRDDDDDEDEDEDDDEEGEVRGESISNALCPLIGGYVHPADNNAMWQVMKLQAYLNVFENAGLAINGTYDSATLAAVNAYQLKYNDDILRPWVIAGFHASENIPTGYVYLTTRKHINEAVCPGYTEPLPPLRPDTNVYNDSVN